MAIFFIKMALVFINKTFIGKDIENKFLQACEKGDISSVNKILRLKVSPNTKDDLGRSALSKASAGIFYFPYNRKTKC